MISSYICRHFYGYIHIIPDFSDSSLNDLFLKPDLTLNY